MINSQTAAHLVGTAADAIRALPHTFHEVLDAIPAPIYVAGPDGTITYYNASCIPFAGRTPRPGVDKWCVTWKIFTPDGEFVPHDHCPMAVAIQDRRPVRDVEAVAVRPDGSKVHFIPYPTPLFDAEGELTGAVNLLVDVTRQRRPEYLREQADRCRRLAAEVDNRQTVETLTLMAEKYERQASKLSRPN